MQTEMLTRLNIREGDRSPAFRPGGWIRSASRTILAGLAVMSGLAGAVDIKVPAKVGVTNAIQDAIDQCPDNDPSGCRILLQGRSYSLANSLLIRNKNNITLTSASATLRPELIFQDDGTLAGPDNDPDSLALKPAGWKHWPVDATTNPGGSKNTSNPFSTNGIQRNGVILVQGSHNILIEGITVNGKAPIGWGSTGIWDGYPNFYGNFGINLYLSGKITIRNTEIKNCFAATYIMNRNLGGALAHKNPGDLDAAKLAPGSRYGEMGGHVIEQSLIHHSVWATFQESNYDLGTTWRFNRFWDLHHNSADLDLWITGGTGGTTGKAPCYNRTNWNTGTRTTTTCDIGDAKNHQGGFMFMKDNVAIPDKIYHNTFVRTYRLFGYGGWRGGTQHYFYNNLVTDPWFDYNKDTSSFLTGNFSKTLDGGNDLTRDMGPFMYANTFATFPKIPTGTAPSKTTCPSSTQAQKDSCAKLITALKAQIWPVNRIQFQTQQVQGTNYNGNYVSPSPQYNYISGFQYQGNERKFMYQPWLLEEPNKTIPSKSYTTSLSANTTPVSKVNFSYTGFDSAVIADRFGRLFSLPDADTVGLLLKVGKLDSARSHINHYIKSVPMNLDSAAKSFMTPVWTDKGVDSVVLNRLWNPSGISTTVGAARARGAMQPDGTNSLPMLFLGDDQPALITGQSATVTFDLNSNIAGVTNLKWVSANFIPSISDAGAMNYTGTEAPLPISLTSISAQPALGGNAVTMTLPKEAGPYSRIELLVSGTAPDGSVIYSNIGLWLIRKSDYAFDVKFFTSKFGKVGQDTVIAGEPVWMRVAAMTNTASTVPMTGPELAACELERKKTPAISCYITTVTNQPYIATVNTFSIKANSMWDADPDVAGSSTIPSTGLYRGGKYVPAVGTDSGTNVWWTEVYFTKSGSATPVMTGLAAGDTGKVFMGAGNIFVRPGAPHIAELKDPASYNLVGDNDSVPMIPFRAKYKTLVDVKDKYGNLVDVTSKVTLTVTPNPLDGYVGGGTDRQVTIDVPATGIGQTVTQAITVPGPIPSLNFFWLHTQIGTATAQVSGTVKDSSKVHVGKATMLYDWDVDTIGGIVKDTFRVNLSILDGDLKLLPASGYKAALSSRNGKIKFYLATDIAMTTPLDSVDLNATGSVALIVTSDEEVLNDTIYAANADVNSGEAAVIAPVNFKKPPEPPFPVADSAAYLDTDCDGKADLLRVWLKGSATSTADLDTSKTPFHAMSLTVESKTVAYDSTEWKFMTGRTDVLDFSVKGVTDFSNIPGKNLLLQYTMRRPPLADTVVDAGIFINVKDRVAPRVDSAVVIENYSSAYDVFIVRFTEPVTSASDAWPFLVKGASLKATGSIKVDEFVADAANSLGANTYRIKIHGNRDAQFNPLYINYSDSIKVDPAAGLVDNAGNPGADCAPMVALVKKAVLPSFVGKISTNDPKGRANLVTLTFSRAIQTQEHIDSLQVDFNGYSKVVVAGANWTTTDNVAWTLVLPDPFPYGVTRGTVADNFGANVTVHGTNLNPPVATYLPSSGKIADSVPAVLVGFIEAARPYAQLTFGNGVDSLRIKLSEAVTSIAGTSGLANALTGSDVGTKDIVKVDDLTWIVVQDTLNTNRVSAGDTVALGNRFQGADGLLPVQGANVSKAVVIGGDRGPATAFYSDSNGVGTASQLTLTFAKALTHEAIFRLMWPDSNGNLITINDTTKGAIGKTSLVLDLAGKFPVGVTGSVLKDLGIMTSVFTGSDTDFVTSEFPPHVRFAIADSVAPIIDSARIVFGTYENSETKFDTLKLYFSEPIKVNGTDFNKALSKLVGTTDVNLTPILPKLELAADGLSGFMLFDTTTGLVMPEKGDSIRLVAGADGGILSDDVNAVAAVKAKRTVVKAGLRKAIPPTLNIILPNPNNKTRTDRESIVLKPVDGVSPLKKTNSNVAILIGSGENANSTFTVVSKSAAANTSMSWGELDGTIGIDIPVNTGTIGERSLITVVLYDSYGTFVGNAEAELKQEDFDTTNTSKSGKSSIKILWDGRSSTGQTVNSGVYMARVLFYREDLQIDNTIKRVMIYNKIKNIGVAR